MGMSLLRVEDVRPSYTAWAEYMCVVGVGLGEGSKAGGIDVGGGGYAVEMKEYHRRGIPVFYTL